MRTTYLIAIDYDPDDMDELDSLIRGAVEYMNESLPMTREVHIRATRNRIVDVASADYSPEG